MVDIHCHLLPGLDDGPDTLEESLAMAEQAIADGITHIVATPHANDRFRFDPELNRRRKDELQEQLAGRLTLATGCDFHLNFDNLRDAAKDPQKYTLGQKNYLLVEFADFAIPPGIDQSLANLQSAGVFPIITHPERNGLIRNSRARLSGWLRQGCYVQVTASAMLGRFGKAAQKFAESLLDSGGVHFFASDAHNTESRAVHLGEAYKYVAKRSSEALAQAVFVENPLAAFEGRALPYVPSVDEQAAVMARPKRFFFF